MNFIVDAQLPLGLSDWLNSQGHNSIHTLNLPNRNKTTDTEILNFAESENRIVITKDIDFYESFLLRNTPKKLLIVATGNISNFDLLKIFEINQDKIIHLLEQNRLVEIDKTNLTVHR